MGHISHSKPANSSHFFLNESLCIYFLSEYSEFGGGHENVVRTLVSCQPGGGHVVRVFSVKVSGAGACGLLVVVTERAGLAVSQLTSSCQGWSDPDLRITGKAWACSQL